MRDDVSAARHAVGRHRSIWAGLVKALAVVVTVVVVSSVSVAAYGAWRLGHKIAVGSIDIGEKPPAGPAALDGAFNVLLVGADNVEGQKGFGDDRERAGSGSRNDVNILVHVSADHRSGTVVSLPRDLVIPHPDCSDPDTGETFPAMSAQPLNTAFSRGGLGCVVGTVEALTGLTIPYAALFSFAGTVKMADAVGGVPVCVTKAIDDTDSGLKLHKGRNVVKGRTALAYLRSRHGVGDGSDLSRIASQQAYMSSLLRTMTSASTFTDPGKLYGLANATADNVKLSQSLADTNTIVRMAVAMKDVDLDRMVFVQYPVGSDPMNSNKVIPNAELATRLMARVQQDKRIELDADALGVSARLSKKHRSAVTASPTPTPSGSASTRKHRSDKALLAGLRGQTAAQQTCSIAAG